MAKEIKMAFDIEEVRIQIEGWRKAKPRGRRMPEELWRLSADLADVHGACRVSKILGLGYEGLKTRMGKNVREIKRGTEANGGGFVEMVNLAGCGPMRVEVSRPDGCQLRLELCRGFGIEAAPLLQIFLS